MFGRNAGAGAGKFRMLMEGSGQFWRRARRHRLLLGGAALVLLFVAAAALAPWLALGPHAGRPAHGRPAARGI